jgi:peptide/nickel transport system substrate-binding protein
MRPPILLIGGFALLGPLLGLTWTGCSSKSADVPQPPSSQEAETEKSFQFGDLIEPFDPPSLAELDKTAGWIDQSVLDSMNLMRARQAKEGPPPLSVTQALALRNHSPEDNDKIAATLGRLAPKDGKEVDFEAQIIRLAGADLKSTNPLLTSSVVESDYHGLTSFGLFGFDWNFNMYASSESVRSWQTSSDRLVDKLVLRDDLTWSDGKPITAQDVEFTFKAIMTDAVIVPALRQGTDQLRYVHAYDDRTVVFFHKEALATNVANMSFSIIPKHIYEKTIPEDPTLSRSKAHSHYEDHPVVGGAYTLEKRVRGQEFVLRRRESAYMHQGKKVRDKPYFKMVRFKVIEDRNTALLALKAGEIDEQMLLADQWQGQTDDDDFYKFNTKVSGLEWTSFHFSWNTKTPYFRDSRVRQAMSWAFDYEEMLQTIFYGLYQQSRGTYHPASWMFPEDGPKPYHQDLDKAEELLDEAGWTDSDGDGIRDKKINGKRIPFHFTLLCVNLEDRLKVATLMKECLDTIGVLCNVKPTEFTVLTQLNRDHNFQAAFAGWGTGADPDTSENIWGTDAGRNYGEYSNPQVDELFQRGKREFDREKRAAIYGEITKLLWEDQPYTWLFYRNSFYAFSKKLRGYNFSPRGPFSYGPGFASIYMPVLQP